MVACSFRGQSASVVYSCSCWAELEFTTESDFSPSAKGIDYPETTDVRVALVRQLVVAVAVLASVLEH